MDDEICSTVVSPLAQSVNRALAEIPNKFRQYLPIIINNTAIKFLNQKPWDHKIKLIAGKIPPKGPFFPLSGKKLEILR